MKFTYFSWSSINIELWFSSPAWIELYICESQWPFPDKTSAIVTLLTSTTYKLGRGKGPEPLGFGKIVWVGFPQWTPAVTLAHLGTNFISTGSGAYKGIKESTLGNKELSLSREHIVVEELWRQPSSLILSPISSKLHSATNSSSVKL